jgi:hypothetical protein
VGVFAYFLVSEGWNRGAGSGKIAAHFGVPGGHDSIVRVSTNQTAKFPKKLTVL